MGKLILVFLAIWVAPSFLFSQKEKHNVHRSPQTISFSFSCAAKIACNMVIYNELYN